MELDPAASGVAESSSLVGSLLVMVRFSRLAAVPFRVMLQGASRPLPTVVLHGRIPAPAINAIMLFALLEGRLKPTGTPAVNVALAWLVLPVLVAVKMVVMVESPPVKVTDEGARLPTVGLEFDSAT